MIFLFLLCYCSKLHWLSNVKPILQFGINSSWSWCIILVMYYWIEIVKMMLRKLVSMFLFLREMRLCFFFFFFVLSHWMSWEVFPPLLFSWENFCRIGTAAVAAAAASLQSSPTLWDPVDGSPPGSSIPGILQSRTLEWVAIAFSNAWKWKVKVKPLGRARLLSTPWQNEPVKPSGLKFSLWESFHLWINFLQ